MMRASYLATSATMRNHKARLRLFWDGCAGGGRNRAATIVFLDQRNRAATGLKPMRNHAQPPPQNCSATTATVPYRGGRMVALSRARIPPPRLRLTARRPCPPVA
jgi:hypothetical protein